MKMKMTIESNATQGFSAAKIAAALLLIILAMTTGAMKAQDAPSAARRLTLTDAVDLALKQNLNIQIANIETAARQQDRVIARSDLLPHASFEADDSENRHNLRALLGLQIPIAGVPHSIGPYEAVHVGPTFSAPVFDLTLIREYQASGHRLQASRAEEQAVREETVLLTVSEYMAHLRALASIKAAESRVDLATRLAQQADDLLKDGMASKIDVSRAQVSKSLLTSISRRLPRTAARPFDTRNSPVVPHESWVSMIERSLPSIPIPRDLARDFPQVMNSGIG